MKFKAIEPVPYEGIWRQTGEEFEAVDAFDDHRAVKVAEPKPKTTDKPVTKKVEANNAEYE